MAHQRALLALICLVTAGLLLLQVRSPLPLVRAEIALRDALAHFGKKAKPHPDLIFLAIDDASAGLDAALDFGEGANPSRERLFELSESEPQSRRALELMSEGWPWPREVHALVLDRLVAAGAKVVIFDLTFPKETEDDPLFRAALDRHRERVIVAGNFVDASLGGATDDATAPRFMAPTPSLIAPASPLDHRIGFDNFLADGLDGVVRSAHFATTLEQLAGWPAEPDYPRYFSIAARTAQKAGLGALIATGAESRALRFAGPPGTFPPHSVFEIFVPSYWQQIWQGGAGFRDKIVIIGAAGNWQQDEHLTPFGLMPGAELHLNAINALFQDEFVGAISWPAGLALIAVGGALAWLLWRGVRRPLVRFAALVALNALWLGVALALFNHAGTHILSIVPLLALNVNAVITLVADIAIERRERRRVRAALERYVSKNVVGEMMERPDGYLASLGGVSRPAAILFSDIRNFTRLCAQTAPHALVAQLNEYLTAMVECVFRHGGTLDKFIGDAVMAVWGNARSLGPAADALAAVRCAVSMREALARLNARWLAEGRLPIEIGVALNHGEVVVGNIGSPHRMEFTVIGDAVNVCWRIQERTKVHRSDLLVGESVATLVAGEFAAEEVGTVLVGETILASYARLTPLGEKAATPIEPAREPVECAAV